LQYSHNALVGIFKQLKWSGGCEENLSFVLNG